MSVEVCKLCSKISSKSRNTKAMTASTKHLPTTTKQDLKNIFNHLSIQASGYHPYNRMFSFSNTYFLCTLFLG